MSTQKSIEQLKEEFRPQYDELGLKAPKNSIPGLERELIADYWCKIIQSERDRAEEVAQTVKRKLSLQRISELIPDGHSISEEAAKSFYQAGVDDLIEALTNPQDNQ